MPLNKETNQTELVESFLRPDKHLTKAEGYSGRNVSVLTKNKFTLPLALWIKFIPFLSSCLFSLLRSLNA